MVPGQSSGDSAAGKSTSSEKASDSAVLKDEQHAVDMQLQRLKSYEKAQPPDQKAIFMTMKDLGLAYREMGSMQQAEEWLLRATAGLEKELGASSSETLHAQFYLFRCYEKQGNFEEAGRLRKTLVEEYETLSKEKEATFGADHLSTIEASVHVAYIYRTQGRWREAEKLFLKGLATFQTHFGTEHDKTLDVMSELAFCYYWQQRYQEAEKLQEKVLQSREKNLGIDHEDTRSAMFHLSSIYEAQRR